MFGLPPLEIILVTLTALIPFLIILGIIYGVMKYFEEKKIYDAEDIVYAYIKKNDKASLDDIVLITQLSYKSAKKVVKNLKKMGVIKGIKEEGVSYYILE
jgi:predicted transcriptional regulator